jgi:RNA polymerase sigma factor (TIGR02999 family)
MGDAEQIDQLLAAVGRAEPGAMDRLIASVYPQLKQLAHFHLARERPGHTLNTTAIVHEAYLRMAAGSPQWADRKHFLRAAAAVMRHLLVDHARERSADKRGGGVAPVTLGEVAAATQDDSVAVIALDDALREMAKIDPRLEQIVECRYFGGLSTAETAEVLELSVRTVERELQRARNYLLQVMEAGRN